MYQLSITRDFIAQHFLIGGDWGAENQRHSHHYRVELVIAGSALDRHGYLIDIVDVDRVLSEVTAIFRDTTLNEHAAFHDLNPSIERFARLLWEMLVQRLALQDKTLSIKLWENGTDWAAYGPAA
ncbi:MAG: 6-carboxytetrahydropterin synthase [Methylococcaceae bacterium]|nr:MAG: 6-carboxytetrahydropterin synthase [Methylococcaceae bacterium]